MKIIVEIEGEAKEMEIDENATGEDLLNKLNLFLDAAIIIVDGKPIPCKEKINGKHVKIINVASRG